MEIKCPICGKKYKYDRKICQDCENYSIYSGVAEIGNKKWNCSVFLGIETMAFSTNKTFKSIKKLTLEPRNFITNERKSYDWKTKDVSRFKRKMENSSIRLPVNDFSTIKKYRSSASLLYE